VSVTSEELLNIEMKLTLNRPTRAIREAMIYYAVKELPKGKGHQPIGGRRESESFKAKDYSCSFAYERETIRNKPLMLSEIGY